MKATAGKDFQRQIKQTKAYGITDVLSKDSQNPLKQVTNISRVIFWWFDEHW